MDSLTHIALGACVGEAFFEKGFGKKAMFWGALAQSIPDVDFISVWWMNTPDALLAHRGFTHSILFGLMMTPVFSLLARQVHRPFNIRFSRWFLFFFVQIFLHLLLDGFNNYGIGWLEPFSHHRYSFNVIFVADPFFSVPVMLSFFMLLILGPFHRQRRHWWKVGFFWPVMYLCYCVVNKLDTDERVNDYLARKNLSHNDYFTTPAPFQNWLWYVVIPVDSGFEVGFTSVFDKKKIQHLRYVRQNPEYLSAVSDHETLQRLIRFSSGYYTVEKWGDTLVFNDLRFGQMLGWRYPQGHFAFHYYLTHSEKNGLVVQRGRFGGWNRDELHYYIRRIAGH